MMTDSPRKTESVNSDLELLLQLQVIDYDLGELERSKEYLPDMMTNLKGEMQETESRFIEARQTLEQSRIDQKNLELDVQTNETLLQKYQQQMMSIKTNKEYDALVAEIDSIKKRISTAETTLLETMERITTIEQEIGTFEEKKGQVQENNSKQLSILQDKIDSIDDKVAAKENERREVVISVPKRSLSIYERVRRGRGGRAVVTVRKRACGACFKALTPKKIQDIKRCATIHTCEACGCLLYWDENDSN